MGVKEKPDIIDIIERKRLQWYGHVKRMQEERLPKLIMEWIPGERRKRGRPRKTWMESSHENKIFRSRSVVKQKGMVFGFRKTATAVTIPERQKSYSVVLYNLLFKCRDYDASAWSGFARSFPVDSANMNTQCVAKCRATADGSTVGSAVQSTVRCDDDRL